MSGQSEVLAWGRDLPQSWSARCRGTSRPLRGQAGSGESAQAGGDGGPLAVAGCVIAQVLATLLLQNLQFQRLLDRAFV